MNADWVEEKDEYAMIIEEEFNPMSYAKVFSKSKYVTFRPQLEGK